ncbi:hypothetical protein SynRS9902_02084 [Synechococcus sp. RS9902]|nr:hypothetical protein SynRS9902_02084 [Synechococcus sp. RS9902]
MQATIQLKKPGNSEPIALSTLAFVRHIVPKLTQQALLTSSFEAMLIAAMRLLQNSLNLQADHFTLHVKKRSNH